MLPPKDLAIAKSVIYASLFDYPLTLEQLRQTLVESQQSRAEIFHRDRSSEALQSIIEHRDGFFFPSGRRDLVATRLQREVRSREFLQQHRGLLRLLCAVPFLRAAALSGSIAHLNMEDDGDLDLFIITRGQHVWSVTVAVIVLAKLLGRRDIVCANFVLADTHLAFHQQDLFAANQVIHLRPLVGRDVLGEILAANPFVTRLYPGFVADDIAAALLEPSALGRRFKTAVEQLLALPAWLLESACRAAYGWYLGRRAASWPSPEQVQLQSDYLKLHGQSHRNSVLERFDRALQEALDRAGRLDAPAPARVAHR